MKELEYPFDSSYLLQHKKSIKRQLLADSNFLEKRIALLSGSTIGETKNILELFLLNQGIKPIFYEGQYDRFYEEVMFETDALIEFKPDIVYIHTTNKNIKEFPLPGESGEEVAKKLKQEFERYSSVWNKIQDTLHCPIIQNNFEPLPYRVLGNRDSYEESGALRFVDSFNHKIYEYALSHSDFYINDLSYEASVIGLDHWYDHSKWYLYKYAFSLEAIPFVAFNIANIIKAYYGKNKKALSLDLDNTLWGGVIGDDGVENIKLGIETSEGMAYTQLQKYIKDLSMTGISLNLCSKNDERIAQEGFGHSSSLLKKEDFIVQKINWDNKDLNIKKTAEELNIMEDAIVFVDDNPVEREIVEQNTGAYVLPITIPDTYVTILDRSGLFECVSLSADDRKRNEYYKQNQKREVIAQQFTDYKEYLNSLQMVCYVDSVNDENIQRITQLINKTNQFNLTTKRLSIEEVKHYAEDHHSIAFCGQLFDKYGDNGIVSVILGTVIEEVLEIDIWLMSCRVFKRDLELAMFDELVKMCQNRGVKKIRGFYSRTKKNTLVENFFESIGFKQVDQDDTSSTWEYDIPVTYEKKNQVMEIRSK
ncbi:MAG: HAD-IIIC family phosphatase [Lachnospiraceae bacterium]|nr:HAD-IIIC family phosphatase [Lachnospiraceae bacterium]